MLGRVMAGARLGQRYQLGRFPLPHKGMGEVWPAQDTLLDRPVIVKFVNATNVDLLRRFRREALLTARLDHPGVPAVHDLGDHEGRQYVVLQKIDGITLADLVAEQGQLPIAWVAAIGAQVSGVLLAARQIGLVHRDIKPSNVMLQASGAVKVLDFGLAVIRGDDRYSRITQSGESLGTLGYMAPEQIVGGQADHRTDLYGLGATLFDLLTAQPPFGDVTTVTTVRHQISDPPPRPSELRADVPAALDDLIHALLAISPEDRPANAAEVYSVLAPLADDLPPIPGVLDDPSGAVRAYAAIVGRVRQTRPVEEASVDTAQAAKRAEQLEAVGEHRAAAREWRRLADERALRAGDDDLRVFEFRVRAARAHLPLGEHDRAVRQLTLLLEQRTRLDGPEHPVVVDLRREIDHVNHARPASAAGR
jgi:eukaryotic-like serine/threonine-protein kinase